MARTKTTVWRADRRIAQDSSSGSGAMSVTFDPEGSARLIQINIHLNIVSATSEDLVINLDSQLGTEWDVNIITEDMDTKKDLILNHWELRDYTIFEGDKVTFTWANSNARTWGLEIIYRRFLS